MNIAIASGKGGTGKTSLAVALFLANKERTRLLDCDVEEPNAHLFLNSKLINEEKVTLPIPVIESSLCKLCGKCVRACQFNALALAGKAGVIVFTELCHSCGACSRACPHGAIKEVETEVGTISKSLIEDSYELVTGRLKIGHSAAPAVIRAVKATPPFSEKTHTIIDSPPGTSCSFVSSVSKSDYVILVTEATPFGLHDLTLAVEGIREIKLPFGVVINRIREEDNLVTRYCKENNIPVLLQIKEDRHVAETYSKGRSLLDALPHLKQELRDLLDRLLGVVE
jgi:MinD superfamily P-loop ATPase